MQNFSWKREYVPALLAIFVIGITLFYYYGFEFTSSISSSSDQTSGDQMQILQSLKPHASTSVDTLSNAEQRKVLDGLTKTQNSGYEFSEAGQLQILKSLKNTQN